MQRQLTHHTWQDVEALEKDTGVVVLPIGAVEQHGPHLPLLTDTLLANSVVERLLEHLPEDVPAWFLPTLPFSKSTEHLGYAGTVALRAETLMAILKDVASSLVRAGFRRLLLLNFHGGNSALLTMIARDIRAETGLLVFVSSPRPIPDEDFANLPELEQRFGIHGGTVETACILADYPELAQQSKAAAHYPSFNSAHVHLTANPSVAWLTRDWSAQGHFGDPTSATARDGQRWLNGVAKSLVEVIADIALFDTAER